MSTPAKKQIYIKSKPKAKIYFLRNQSPDQVKTFGNSTITSPSNNVQLTDIYSMKTMYTTMTPKSVKSNMSKKFRDKNLAHLSTILQKTQNENPQKWAPSEKQNGGFYLTGQDSQKIQLKNLNQDPNCIRAFKKRNNSVKVSRKTFNCDKSPMASLNMTMEYFPSKNGQGKRKCQSIQMFKSQQQKHSIQQLEKRKYNTMTLSYLFRQKDWCQEQMKKTIEKTSKTLESTKMPDDIACHRRKFELSKQRTAQALVIRKKSKVLQQSGFKFFVSEPKKSVAEIFEDRKRQRTNLQDSNRVNSQIFTPKYSWTQVKQHKNPKIVKSLRAVRGVSGENYQNPLSIKQTKKKQSISAYKKLKKQKQFFQQNGYIQKSWWGNSELTDLKSFKFQNKDSARDF